MALYRPLCDVSIVAEAKLANSKKCSPLWRLQNPAMDFRCHTANAAVIGEGLSWQTAQWKQMPNLDILGVACLRGSRDHKGNKLAGEYPGRDEAARSAISRCVAARRVHGSFLRPAQILQRALAPGLHRVLLHAGILG